MNSFFQLGAFRAVALGLGAPLLVSCAGAFHSADPGTVSLGTSSGVVLPSAPLSGKAPPSVNFDLSNWKLMLPSGEAIAPDTLVKGYQREGLFYTDPGTGGMSFKAPNLAGQATPDKYSRTELRQALAVPDPAKGDASDWTTSVGGTLKARVRVDAVSSSGDETKTGRVILGQIQGPATEVVQLYFEKLPNEAKGRVYVGTDKVWMGATAQSEDIISNRAGGGIGLGEAFNYEIRLKGLSLAVIVEPPEGATAVFTQRIDPGYEGKALYFEAGVLNPNDAGNAGDFAQATFFNLEASNP
ncbi:poly(beta-D-mannuronate) lyase [Panacagrimonas perspica]|uniref:Poly(Beta-D-mannuronate) lyase n=1 Tax=Panacagrimonas perspica TaxID=381431 RepID=A0A4S3K108_9GAMM|nr:polysaccharide lyase family 7 protein [Panacagrimonas perspica]TDU30675.1 poly(beta-D-mannuronate) lyase [Panacagrimonas perspica]THD01508.1 hypothetical protein B1810_18440 [Panacagrimonas perspica]